MWSMYVLCVFFVSESERERKREIERRREKERERERERENGNDSFPIELFSPPMGEYILS